MMRYRTVRGVLAAAAIAVGLAGAAPGPAAWAADPPKPGKTELQGAEMRMTQFEDKVRRMRGQPFKLDYMEREALQRIDALKKKYPDDPDVAKLAERARLAILASGGETKEVAADATAYRNIERRLRDRFATTAAEQWDAFMETVKASKEPLLKAFPPPSHEEESIDDLKGRYVVLEEFEYPANQFEESGRSYVFVGSGARGYYYVDLSGRAWLGVYEAVKRYRRFVNQDVPADLKWTMVGRISGIQLLVPQAGEKKTGTLHWGWTVEPVAVRVPDRTFARADAERALGGAFAGEERMEEMKAGFYTITSVAADAPPEKVVEAFVTAIKEKNYPLYLECIEPARRKSPKDLDLCLYHWEWHQQRFATLYCEIKTGAATTRVVRGMDEGDALMLSFLTEADKAKLKQTADPLEEEAALSTQAFDERGKQYGSPKPRLLRRVEKKRWYIADYAQPF